MCAAKPTIWVYQRMFQISAKVAAESIFKKLDPNLNPSVFLLGIPQSNTADFYHICIEPEQGSGYSTEFFSGVIKLAVQIQSAEDIAYGSLPVKYVRDERKIEGKALRSSVLKTLERHDNHRDVVSFCSWPAYIQSYMVCVILQFTKRTYQSHYSLLRDSSDSINAPSSLLDAVTAEFLNSCSRALAQPEEPGLMLDIIERDHEEIIRSAGKRFMATPSRFILVTDETHNLFETCNTVSASKYEGSEAGGKIIIARRGHPNINPALIFKSPVPINNTRAVRKLLEITNNEFSLLSDSLSVYGLGTLAGTYDHRNEDLFTIEFTKHYTWDLLHADNLMMRVAYGQPSIPTGHMDYGKFKPNVKQIFPEIDDEAVDNLWRLAVEAARQKHGTMLVISDGAQEEAERLSGQSTNILPVKMTPDILRIVSAIDGAVLIDFNSICYAIGAILDGVATEKGDASRGARFNSAVRYVESTKYQCLIIVVSEDGMINLIPNS